MSGGANGQIVEAMPDFDGMNITQLRKYAADNNIEISADTKSREDILDTIVKNVTAENSQP